MQMDNHVFASREHHIHIILALALSRTEFLLVLFCTFGFCSSFCFCSCPAPVPVHPSAIRKIPVWGLPCTACSARRGRRSIVYVKEPEITFPCNADPASIPPMLKRKPKLHAGRKIGQSLKETLLLHLCHASHRVMYALIHFSLPTLALITVC